MIDETSIELHGYMYTYHPKPEGYSTKDWSHMVKCYHTSKGRIVHEVLFAKEFYDDGPYPKESRTKSNGVEVKWTGAVYVPSFG